MNSPKLNQNLTWLRNNKDLVKIRQIEIELDMPEGTLKKFVDDRRDLPLKWHEPVISRVKKLRK